MVFQSPRRNYHYLQNENGFHDTIEEGVLSLQDNREAQYDKNFKHQKTTTTEPTTNNDKVGSNAEPFHGQNLGHTEERNKPINRSPEIEIPSIYNDTEVELLKTAELIQVALDASDALDLLQNGYHRNGMILISLLLFGKHTSPKQKGSKHERKN